MGVDCQTSRGSGTGRFCYCTLQSTSGRRTRQIVEAQKILLKYRSPETPVGLVKSAYRDRQNIVITILAHA